MGISSYSTVAASNTSISGTNIAEGCAPSGINNAIRQLMADIAAGVQLAQLPTATGTANALVVALSPAKGAYVAGERFQFLSSASGNTGAATINYGTGGVINIKKKGQNPANLVDLALGDIPASSLIDVEYDGTQAILLNPAAHAHGADIVAAATINLSTATGDYPYVTGNTGITAITLAEGAEITTKFTGTPTITASGTLIPPGGATYTVVANDVIMWRGEAGGLVRAVGGVKANGAPWVAVTNAMLATMAASTIKANLTGGAATPTDASLSAILDLVGSAAQGDILYRGAATWTRLAAGTSGQTLTTGGAGANPSWSAASGMTIMAKRTPGAVTTDTQTGIPSTAKRVTINFQGLTKGGTGDFNIQIGPSGGVVSAGYVGWSRGTSNTAGMAAGTSWSALGATVGSVLLTLMDSTNNVWAWQGNPSGAGFHTTMGGYIALSGPLERIMITDQGGAPGNFSAGSWNVNYE